MYDDDLQFNKVGRAADIWSYGCVLLQILVLRFQGPEAVATFRRSRGRKIDGIKRRRFHDQHRLNPAVLHHLESLRDSVAEASIVCKALSQWSNQFFQLNSPIVQKP